MFVKWCERIDAIDQGMHDKILLPNLSKHEDQRDAMLDSEDADQLIEYLRQFEFGTRTHALIEVLWHTGMRIGAAHSLDLEDYDAEEQYLRLQHRPETGTRLKNKQDGERVVALNPDICDTLDAYLQYNRIEVRDDFGRTPLFTSQHGRPSKSTLRDSIYRMTRPCEYTGDCPHRREIESCEAMERNKASKCLSSVSPHAIRRGSILHSVANFIVNVMPYHHTNDVQDDSEFHIRSSLMG